jgi:hypothetical protein
MRMPEPMLTSAGDCSVKPWDEPVRSIKRCHPYSEYDNEGSH